MGERSAELLLGDLLVGHRLHHVRPGDEHVRRVLHHEDEVGHRRRVDGASGARTHDERDLRDHPGREHVALEHLGVAGERRHPLLDACAARVVETDHRDAHLHRLVHHLADLPGVGGGEGAAEDGEVLAEREHPPAVHEAVADHHPVAGDPLPGHPEVVGIVLDEHVPLLEGPFVEEQIEALARGELALGVLGRDPPLAAAEARGGPAALEFLEDVLHGAAEAGRGAGGNGEAGTGRGAGRNGGEAGRRPRGQAARRRPRTSPSTSRAATGMEAPGP